MARRRQLQGVAGNLAAWASSRQNDLHGYWALGLLCEQALHDGALAPRLVLWPRAAAHAARFQPVAEAGRERLRALCRAQGLPLAWLGGAALQLRFAAEPPSPGALRDVACEVSLWDDRARRYVARAATRCHAHDPGRTTQRAGAVAPPA